MGFPELFKFLERLQKNNSKDWMDIHRKEYVAVRDFFIAWLDRMNDLLAATDDDYFYTPGKKAINRINNNLLYHPNRPVYKDHFGAGLDQLTKQGDFYIELGVEKSFLGGGYWHPSSDLLGRIRNAIDYNGEELKSILQQPSFRRIFGDMVDDEPLKTAPKGFSIDHEHIDLLRRRSFAVVHYVSREEIAHPDFEKKVIKIYKEMLPFRRYLNEAVTVE
jgi:uncharacterized protein (TIGR02453 family)